MDDESDDGYCNDADDNYYTFLNVDRSVSSSIYY